MFYKLRLKLYQLVIDNAVEYALKHDDDALISAVGQAANELHYMRVSMRNDFEEINDGRNHKPKFNYMKDSCLLACCN